jgi:L-threonylcarbamoyladenylate synthase
MGVVPDGAAELLRDGALAILPTDTVYGIACTAGNEQACAQLYALKQRPADQATAIMAGSVARLLGHTLPDLPASQAELVQRVMPGPVTLILSNPAARFRHLCGGAPEKIGVRVPDLDPDVANLADAANALLITSANERGEPAPASLQQVPARLRGACALVVDGGELPGLASSVIDVTGREPVLLRDGPDAAALLGRLR